VSETIDGRFQLTVNRNGSERRPSPRRVEAQVVDVNIDGSDINTLEPFIEKTVEFVIRNIGGEELSLSVVVTDNRGYVDIVFTLHAGYRTGIVGYGDCYSLSDGMRD